LIINTLIYYTLNIQLIPSHQFTEFSSFLKIENPEPSRYKLNNAKERRSYVTKPDENIINAPIEGFNFLKRNVENNSFSFLMYEQ